MCQVPQGPVAGNAGSAKNLEVRTAPADEVKTPKQRGTSSFVTAIEAEQSRATGARAANVPARICMALIQSTIIWVLHPRTATWDQPTISVPFKSPFGDNVYTQLPCGVEYNGVTAGFAVCAMLECLFGPGDFAKRSFANAMSGLIQKAGSHLRATVHALPLFREVQATVLGNLAGIQAFAVEVIPQCTLKGAAMARATKKSGLVPVSARRRPKVAAYQRKFARTPDTLRADMEGIIERALPEFERDWIRGPMPICQGNCGQPICAEPIVSEGTIKAVLTDGMWSGPTV